MLIKYGEREKVVMSRRANTYGKSNPIWAFITFDASLDLRSSSPKLCTHQRPELRQFFVRRSLRSCSTWHTRRRPSLLLRLPSEWSEAVEGAEQPIINLAEP